MALPKVRMVRPFAFLCLLSCAFFEWPLAGSTDVFPFFLTFERVANTDQFAIIQNGTAAVDSSNNRTILRTEGEGHRQQKKRKKVIYKELRGHIQWGDQPKAIFQLGGRSITRRLYLEPFCWLKGICWSQNRTDTFVFCNGRSAGGIIRRILRMNGCEQTEEKGKERNIGVTKEFGEWSMAFHGVAALSNGKRNKKGQKAENAEQHTNEGPMSERDQRRMCRYRISCYQRAGFSHLAAKRRKQSDTLLSTKVTPPEGTKRTMKQMAKVAIKGVERREAEGKTKKRMDERDGETVLANYWNEREKKLRCKYRKSCYRTGQKPNIERSTIANWWHGDEPRGDQREEGTKKQWEAQEGAVEWAMMDERQRRVFCRYRKSCYEKGNRSETAERRRKWQWGDNVKWDGGLADKVSEYWSRLRTMVEGRERAARRSGKKTENGGQKGDHRKDEEDGEEEQRRTKLDCKYRRSCYETGQLPEALKRGKDTEERREEEEEGLIGGRGKKVPSSVKELKLYCKYRKSCYVASATAPRITEPLAESSGNKTGGGRTEKDGTENIVGDGQRATKRQTKSTRNSDESRDGREEGVREKMPKRIRNERRRKMGAKEGDSRGTEEDGDKEEEEKRSEGEGEEKEADASGRKEDDEEEEKKGEEEEEKEKREKRRKQRKSKISCLPEKLVKEKKEKLEGCKEKRTPNKGEEASSVKEDESRGKNRGEKEVEKAIKRKGEKERKGKKPKRKSRRRKEERKLLDQVEVGIREETEEQEMEVDKETRNKLGKEKEREEKGEEEEEELKEKMKERVEEEEEQEERVEKENRKETRKEEEEKQKSKAKRKKKKYKVEAAQLTPEKAKAWVRGLQRLSQEERLECRYRKSCYATGTRPTTKAEGEEGEQWWHNWEWHNLWTTLPGKSEESNSKWEDTNGWDGMDERKKKLKCQYRKSCYERNEQNANGTEAKKPSARRTEPRREKTTSVAGITQKTIAREADKRKREEARRREEAVLKSIDLDTKLECKYRKSCYEESGTNKMAMARPNGIGVGRPSISVARQSNGTKAAEVGGGGAKKCNQWRISCREAMGLTVREKAPIGKDGRKMCRKMKKERERGEGENTIE